MYAYFVMGCVLIFAICADKGIACMVENIEETVVERQSCTENGSENYLVSGHVNLRRAQRCHHRTRFIIQCFGDFESLKLTDTHHIVTKKQAVFLIVLVADFCQILVNDGVLLREINDFHSCFQVFLVHGRHTRPAKLWQN